MVRFDRYRVDGKVGVGGLADVYRASLVDDDGGPEDLKVGQVVALKVLRDPARSPASLRRFLAEGELLKSLEHPGLPRCFEVVEGARPFLVLELLEGLIFYMNFVFPDSVGYHLFFLKFCYINYSKNCF